MRVYPDSGVYVDSLQLLRCVLNEWQRLNTELGLAWIRDGGSAPWWDNERSSISVLAGAIWLCGGWVFEESTAVKTIVGRRDRKLTGRCDIIFRIGKRDFIAEAKKCWPNIGNAKKAKEVIGESLEAALRASNQMADWGYDRLAITFATPMLHVSKQDRIDALIQEFITYLLKMRKVAIAWTFPRIARNLRPINHFNENYIFPGAVLLIRQAS